VSIWQVEPDRRDELMDDPALPAADHLAALDALATINAVSLTSGQLARAVRRIAALDGPRSGPGGSPLRIVDVACGGGDLSVALADRLARQFGPGGGSGPPPVELLGIDLSPRAIERARRHAASRGCGLVDFAVRDVLAEGCPPCDVAVSSLFLHHLDDGRAADLLRSMAAAARLGGAVSDLVRSRTGLILAVLGTTLLARSRVARVDGPLSVRAARTPVEYRRLADRAGLPHAAVSRTWPERILLEWRTAEAVDELVPGVACA
jgi:2-polyprenyl-3-methyl-5-hydroxy-6-metoxy-1,4-benzoquinol methylase